MMTTTWSDTWDQPSKAIRTRHIRYWLSVFGLAIADSLSFLIVDFLCRHGHSVPTLVMFFGNNANKPSTPINVFALLALAFVAVRYLSGDYGRRQLFWDGAKVTTIALLVTSLPDIAMLLLGNGIYAPWPVLLSWMLLLFLLPIMRQCARILMARVGIWQIPTALIGISPRSSEICMALKGSLSLGFDMRWLVIENDNASPPENLASLKTIHSTDPARIAAMVCEQGCKEAIVAAEDMQSTHFADVVQRLLEVNVPVAIIPSINRLPLANVTTNYFFGRDILLLQVHSNAQRLPSRIVKRSFDLAISALLLIILAPLFLAFAIAIKVDGPGNITYSQRRVGRHGRHFDCLKFRTMAPNADALLERWKTENPDLYKEFLITFKLRDDPRVTRIGKWLRKTSLDELPQLWNVLRGDMSLVGPRPIPEQQLRDQYGAAAQLYVRVRPGMSGLWQISGRSETTSDQRVILDEWYILNWSFWYDIVILIQTAWIVATGKGAF
ncbi:MAG TPA: undecaprenyl-phosphate galactose phosphotransferase WbaP [Rhizomicrobium sp.]|jgi:undecaprenyl-phosphate galactose phosphotransferase